MGHLKRELGMLVALIAMGAIVFMSNDKFLGLSNSGNLLRNTSMLGIYSIGMAFVIITGGIDLSLGSLIGLTGVLLAKFCAQDDPACYGWSLWVGIPLTLAIMLAIGLIQGLIITMLDLQPFIVTLAGMMIFRGVAQTIGEGGTLSIGDIPLAKLANGGFLVNHGSALISWPLIIFVLVCLFFAYLLHFTVFGRYVYAIGGNRDAAKYSGLNVKRIETMTYVISAGLAAVSGICYASYIGGMNQDVGRGYELYAVAAAVLGGCSLRGGEGTIFGVVVGAGMYTVIYNAINMFQLKYHDAAGKLMTFRPSTNWTDWIIGIVILIAVVLDQVAKVIQARRRIKKVAANPPAPQAPTTAVPATSGV